MQIHKEVEKELAKRSHFCNKVIKKQKARIEELEKGKTIDYDTPGPQKSGSPVLGMKGKGYKSSLNTIRRGHRVNQSLDITSGRNADGLVGLLEHKLEESDRKLKAINADFISL